MGRYAGKDKEGSKGQEIKNIQAKELIRTVRKKINQSGNRFVNELRMDIIRVFDVSNPDDNRTMQAWLNRLDALEKFMARYNLDTLRGIIVGGRDLGEEFDRKWKTWILVPGAVRVLSKADPMSSFAGRSVGDEPTGNIRKDVDVL